MSEVANNLIASAHADLVDVICEGPIRGLVNGLKSVFLDDVPIENDDGTRNFEGVELEVRLGYYLQAPFTSQQFVASEDTVGTEVTFGNPVIRNVANAATDGIKVSLTWPALLEVDGGGNIKETSVQFKIWMQASEDAGYVLKLDRTITGKQNGTWEIDFDIPCHGTAPWNVKVERVSADDADTKHQTRFLWSRITELLTEKMSYSDSAAMGLTFKAKQFGSRIPPRSYDCYLREIQIPSNYNPTTRAYTGLWDGTFVIGWTDNPAWVLYDLLTSRRFGLGNRLSVDQIDKWKLYEIAQYNDELVDDGNGGTEPRFTFNGILTEDDTAVNVLAAVAGSFNTVIYWSAGFITFSQDSPADPVRVISPANTIDGTFTYSGSGISARHTIVNVLYIDPTTGREALVPVEDADAIALYGYNEATFYAMGCTSRGLAMRMGRYVLETEKAQTELVTWKAGWEQVDLRPGDICVLHDPAVADVRYGGRLAGVTSTTVVTLDFAIEVQAGYVAYIMLPDGTVHESDCTIAGDGVTLTLLTPMASAAAVGAMWVVEQPDVQARLVRIVSVRETDPGVFTLTALNHDPDKYARIETGFDSETPDSYTATDSLPAPEGLTVIDFQYLEGAVWKTGLLFSWEPVRDGRVASYQLQISDASGVWYGTQEITEPLYEMRPANTALTDFRVRSLGYQLRAGAIGQSSPWTEAAIDLVDTPPAITVVETAKGGSRTISWTYANDPNLPGWAVYTIKDTYGVLGSTDKGTLSLATTGIPAAGSNTITVAVSEITYGTYALTPLGNVTSLAAVESIQWSEGLQQLAASLSWTEVVGAAYYEVWQKLPTGVWTLLDYVEAATAWVSPWLPAAQIGNTIDYAVVAVKADGARKAPGLAANVSLTFAGDVTAPDAPAIAVTEVSERGERLIELTLGATPDLSHFRVRVDGASVGNPPGSTPSVIASVPLYGAHTVAAEAVDLAGNVSSTTTYNLTPLGSVTGIALGRTVAFVNRQPVFRLDVSWNTLANASYYEIWWRCTDGVHGFAWALAGTTTGLTFTAPDVSRTYVGLTFEVAVIPVRTNGARPLLANAAYGSYVLAGDTTAPSAPSLTITEIGVDGIRLMEATLTPTPDDLDHFLWYVGGSLVGRTGWNVPEFEVTITAAGTISCAVYAVDTSGNTSAAGSYSLTPPANPATLTATEALTYPLGYVSSNVELAWASSAGAAYYEVWHLQGAEWVRLTATANLAYTHEDVAFSGGGTTNSYRVVPVAADGARVAPASGKAASVTCYGDNDALDTVDDFLVEETAERWRRFYWDSAPFEALADFKGYQLRYTRGTTDTWGEALPLNDGYIARPPFELRALPEGASQIFIKAFDQNGNESSTASVIVVNLGDREIANIIDQTDFGPAWAGTISGATIDGDDLISSDSGDPLYQNGGAALFYTNGGAALMYGTTTYDGFTYQDTFGPVDAGVLTIVLDADGPPFIYYKPDAESVWVRYTSPVWVAADTYDIKVELGVSTEQTRIRQLSAVVDLPDMEERISDVSIGNTGTRLTLTKTFTSITAVSLTLQDTGGTGAVSAQVVDRDEVNGPLIYCYDAGGTLVAATVDAVIQGY